MDFLKKHYEKVLLGVMLAGLIGGLVFMLLYINSDQQAMAEKGSNLTNPKVKPLPNLDMTILDGTINRAQEPFTLDLENSNRLFNPLEWQKSLDGQGLILKTLRTGPQVVVVTNISPLYTLVWLDSVMTNDMGVRYVIKIQRQGAAQRSKRMVSSQYVSVGDKPNSDFTLLSVKGPPENPEDLELKLADNNQIVHISKTYTNRETVAYAADFRYDPERYAAHGCRTGEKLRFGGGQYTVDEVNQNELILEDQSNHKKTSLPFTP